MQLELDLTDQGITYYTIKAGYTGDNMDEAYFRMVKEY